MRVILHVVARMGLNCGALTEFQDIKIPFEIARGAWGFKENLQ